MTAEEKRELGRIRADRKGVVDSELFPGLKQLLSQFYPDKNHFIYELLQNAEDAGASNVRFEVMPDKLLFVHNGSEPFSIKHIKAITSIANSTKTTEDSKAGKFGIGFKSVFAFTETPHIYTDDICFKITDMFLPEEIPQRTVNGETIFEFPFDNSKLPADVAIEKIEAGLKDINATTLLFLSNVKEIVYTLSNGKSGIIEAKHDTKSKQTDTISEYIFSEFVHCSSAFDDGKVDEDTDWLRFNRRIAIQTEDDKTKTHWVNIAFPVKRDNSQQGYSFSVLTKDTSQNSPQGKVSIFFIAPNAKSNLQFHINAPFGCPPSRDSVSDTPDNDNLVDEIASLVREAIINLRDIKELKPDFFNFLPLESDNVDKQFMSIQKAILDVFEAEMVYPIINCDYAHKRDVISAGEDLRKLLSIENVRTILNNQSIEYLLNPQTRGYTFIKENGVLILDASTILNGLLQMDVDSVNTLFLGRKHEWYKSIYNLLSPVRDYFDLDSLSECNIVCSKSNRLLKSSEVKFVDDTTVVLDKRFDEVSKTVYEQDGSGKSKARLFLEAVGVEVFSKNDAQAIKDERRRDNLQHKLECLTDKDDVIAIIKSVIAYINANENSNLSLNLNVPFVLSKSGKLVKPSDCYLDSPYIETGFSVAENIHHRVSISETYKTKLNEVELKKFISLLTANGALYSFRIVQLDDIRENKKYKELNTWPRSISRETYWTKRDWNIPNLSSYLSLNNKSIMLMVWTTIMDYRHYYWQSEDINQTKAFRRWQQTVYNRCESQIVQILRDFAWLPDVDGNYRKPSEVSPDSLDKDFHINSDSPFLTAIEFGREENERRKQLEEEERRRTSEYQKKEYAANVFGYDVDTLEEKLRKAELYECAEAEGRIAPKADIEEPTANTNNSEKRTAAAIETTINADGRIYEQKTRSVRTSQTKNEATTMLRRLYTNHDDKMICQCCGKELPFKKKNGEYYFVTLELHNTGGEFFTKETPYPYIACCPNCAAMFNEHIVHCSSNENRISDLLNIIESGATIKKPNGNEVVEIIMDGKIFNLTFVQKHIVDIRAAIKAQKD
ncbi:MAG: hypothetical protein K2G96_05120 [Clostridia bacterium]|nr:hypothetical protein [Clostridia bacterium]